MKLMIYSFILNKLTNMYFWIRWWSVLFSITLLGRFPIRGIWPNIRELMNGFMYTWTAISKRIAQGVSVNGTVLFSYFANNLNVKHKHPYKMYSWRVQVNNDEWQSQDLSIFSMKRRWASMQGYSIIDNVMSLYHVVLRGVKNNMLVHVPSLW